MILKQLIGHSLKESWLYVYIHSTNTYLLCAGQCARSWGHMMSETMSLLSRSSQSSILRISSEDVITKSTSVFITRAFGHIENKVLFSGAPAALVSPLEHGFPDECVKLN